MIVNNKIVFFILNIVFCVEIQKTQLAENANNMQINYHRKHYLVLVIGYNLSQLCLGTPFIDRKDINIFLQFNYFKLFLFPNTTYESFNTFCI